jgi:acetyl esterase/lipase
MPRRTLIAVVMGLGSLLQGCAFTLVNWTTPDDGYSRVETLSYGDHRRQALDIYFPAGADRRDPVVVFFYGGGWEGGHKDDYQFVAQVLTDEGYTVVIPDYRIYPEVTFPSFIKDAAAAVAKVRRQFPDRPLVLVGHSSGAHLAAMLVTDTEYLREAGVRRSAIKAWVGLSGPYDFLPLTSDKLRNIFSGADNLDATQPVNFVDAQVPPTLLIQGLDDKRVIPRNSQRLENKLKEYDVPVTAIYYQGVGHIGTIAAMAPVLGSWSDSLEDTLAFLEKFDESGRTPQARPR